MNDSRLKVNPLFIKEKRTDTVRVVYCLSVAYYLWGLGWSSRYAMFLFDLQVLENINS